MQAPYHPNQICDNIAEAINQVIVVTTPNDKLTVKMRGILDKAIKYCLENNRKSLVNVRDYIINLNEKGTSETKDGIIQRINFLLNDERLLPIICGNNTIEWGKFIQEGKTFILDCFGMSKEKMIFVGSLISQGFKNFFRYERPKEYKPLALYIDECHNYLNYNFYDILKEGRKYKLSCILSTQDFSLVDDHMTRVMLNVGTIIAFKLGSREAQFIAKEIDCEATDIQFLEKYHFYLLTPEIRGKFMAPRPPIFKKLEVKRVELSSKPISKKSQWFPLEAYKGN
jgi:hypothetical protein